MNDACVKREQALAKKEAERKEAAQKIKESKAQKAAERAKAEQAQKDAVQEKLQQQQDLDERRTKNIADKEQQRKDKAEQKGNNKQPSEASSKYSKKDVTELKKSSTSTTETGLGNLPRRSSTKPCRKIKAKLDLRLAWLQALRSGKHRKEFQLLIRVRQCSVTWMPITMGRSLSKRC